MATVPVDQLDQVIAPEVLGGARASTQAQYAAQAKATTVKEDTPILDRVGAATAEWDTTKIVQKLQQEAEHRKAIYDPNWDAQSQYQSIRKSYGLPDNPEVQRQLASAINADEAAQIAGDLRDHYDNQAKLEGSVAGFGVSMLDPLTLVIDGAAFGTGRLLKLGRVGAGVLGAAANVGYLGMVDGYTRDVSTAEYLLTGALSGGAHALFGGATGVRGAAARFGDEAPVAAPAEAATPLPKVPPAPVPPAPEQAVAAAVGSAEATGTWAGNVFESKLSGLHGFLSEYDRIAPTPELRDRMSLLLDDPVRRTLTNNNAASLLRRNANVVDGLSVKYEDVLGKTIRQQSGIGPIEARIDLHGNFTAARDALEKDVAAELFRREAEAMSFGPEGVTKGVAPKHIDQLADEYEKYMAGITKIGVDSGLLDGKMYKPGYFHREWVPENFTKVEQMFANADPVKGTKRARKFLREMFIESLRRGANLTRAESKPIAQAMLTRMASKAERTRIDFLGGIGKTETEAIRELLVEGGLDEAYIKSVMHKLESRVEEAGTIKYTKSRLPFDMTTSIDVPLVKGSTKTVRLNMADFVSTDLSRLADNYGQAIAGRSALSKAGIGGTDAQINAFRTQYAKDLGAMNLTRQDLDERLLQLDHVLGDFTGQRPANAQLSQLMQRAKAFASSTMMGASGLLQVGDYATIAARFGIANTTKEFLRTFPGIKRILGSAGPDLKDEVAAVLGTDLARDVRIHPWLRQHETFITSRDGWIDRTLHAGKQWTPILNGMKYVHAHQARITMNLALNTLVKAANGNGKAIKMLAEYGLRGAEFRKVADAVRRNCDTIRGNARSMGWAGWLPDEIDSAMNVALRMADDAVLYGRSGQGSAFTRSAVGQVLGQFTQFTAFAHNKLLRGTLYHKGLTGMAIMLSYQYPLTFLVTWANEARKGALDDATVDSIAKKALGYTAGLGFFSEAAGIVGLTGQYGSRSAPVLGILSAPSKLMQATAKGFGWGSENGQPRQADPAGGAWKAGDVLLRAVPGVAAFPATNLLMQAIKPEK